MQYIPFDSATYIPLIKRKEDSLWDPVRKQWIISTPEEWVRQVFLQYLINDAHISPSLIAVERMIQLGKLKKRYDIVIYNADLSAYMLIECKGPNIPLKQQMADQAATYNQMVKAPYLCLFNGSYALMAHIDFVTQQTSWLNHFPWSEEE